METPTRPLSKRLRHGLCEAHYQEGNVEDGTVYSLEWDDGA